MDSAAPIVSRPPPVAPGARKKSTLLIPALVGAGLIGGAAGFFGVRHGMDLMVPVPGPKLLKLVTVAAFPFIWLVVVGFHELGHLVGGWLGGGKFLLWVAGPFMVRRSPGGIRLGWNRNVNTAGGMAACLPFDPAKMTPGRVAVMVLGGPLASLLLAAASLWLAAWLAGGPAPVSAARALTQNVAMFAAGLSLVIFLVTMVPSSAGGFKSDGKRVFELARGGPRSTQEAAVLMLTMASLAGIRPADYDRGLVAQATALGDGSLFDLYGHVTVYYHAADRGDWPAAQAHLDHVLAGADKLAPYIRDVVYCEYAWLLAGRTRDAAIARAWLDSAGRLEFEPATRLRAEAAVLLAEGHRMEAAAKAHAGLIALEHKSLSPVKSAFAADALEALLRQAGG